MKLANLPAQSTWQKRTGGDGRVTYWRPGTQITVYVWEQGGNVMAAVGWDDGHLLREGFIIDHAGAWFLFLRVADAYVEANRSADVLMQYLGGYGGTAQRKPPSKV